MHFPNLVSFSPFGFFLLSFSLGYISVRKLTHMNVFDPEKEVFVDALQEQVAIEKSSGGKVKLSWKSFFKRFWSWAKGLFRSW